MNQTLPPPQPGWRQAELHIIDRINHLSRWDAERWAAAHERQRSRITQTARQVSNLRAASAGPAGDYLGAAFGRIDDAANHCPWAHDTTAGGDGADVMDEIVTAVAEVAQHALATVVLATVVPGGDLPGDQPDEAEADC